MMVGQAQSFTCAQSGMIAKTVARDATRRLISVSTAGVCRCVPAAGRQVERGAAHLQATPPSPSSSRHVCHSMARDASVGTNGAAREVAAGQLGRTSPEAPDGTLGVSQRSL